MNPEEIAAQLYKRHLTDGTSRWQLMRHSMEGWPMWSAEIMRRFDLLKKKDMQRHATSREKMKDLYHRYQ